MDKKKVLMVHNFYQVGGGEHTVFKNEVEMLRENGHEVVEYTRSNDELKSSKWKLATLPFTTIWSWKTYREVRKLIKDEQIDIVHCHNTFPLISPSVYYAARERSIPVVQTIHNFRLLCPRGTFFCNGEVCEKCNDRWDFKEAIANNCYHNSKIQTSVLVAMLKMHRLLGTYKKVSYIFLTEFNKRKFRGLLNIDSDQVFVKPNFVDSPNNDEICFRKLSEDSTSFIYVGRLDKEKGIINLLRHWSAVPKKYQLHIYGDGECKNEVIEAAREGGNIIFHGFKSHTIVLEAMKNAVALVTPYVCYEGYPMVIAESFSLSTPVITANVGNANDLVKESSGGYIFDFRSNNPLSPVLEELCSRREYYSNNARNYYVNNQTKLLNYKRIIEIYDKLRVIK